MRRTERVLGIVTGLAVAALSAFTAPAAQAAQSIGETDGRQSSVQVIAHRGSSGAAPENTLAAVELALRQGADVVETTSSAPPTAAS